MSYNYKSGQKVVKLLSVFGIETASIQRVASVRKGLVTLTESQQQYRDSDGVSVETGAFTSRLVPLEAEDD